MLELQYGRGSWSVNERDSDSRVDVRKNGLGMRSQKDQNAIACMLLLFESKSEREELEYHATIYLFHYLMFGANPRVL